MEVVAYQEDAKLASLVRDMETSDSTEHDVCTRHYWRPASGKFYEEVVEEYGQPRTMDLLHFTFFDASDTCSVWLYKKKSCTGVQWFVKRIVEAKQTEHHSWTTSYKQSIERTSPPDMQEIGSFEVLRFGWGGRADVHLDVTKFANGQFQVLFVTEGVPEVTWSTLRGGFPNILEYLYRNRAHPSSQRLLEKALPRCVAVWGPAESSFPESFFPWPTTIGPLLAKREHWDLEEKLPDFVGDRRRCWAIFHVCRTEYAHEMLPDVF